MPVLFLNHALKYPALPIAVGMVNRSLPVSPFKEVTIPPGANSEKHTLPPTVFGHGVC